jgi:hypothetical protein
MIHGKPILDHTITWLPILHHTLADVRVIHAQLCKHGVVTGPSVLCTVWVDVVILEVNVLLAIRVAESNLCGLALISGHNTTADHIHQVNYCGDRDGLANQRGQHSVDIRMQLDEGLGACCNSTKALSSIIASGKQDVAIEQR